MEKRSTQGAARGKETPAATQSKQPMRKTTEYGRQLLEKQKVKHMYGVREKQFKRFFAIATKSREATGEALLTLLERRLDNVVFRLKYAATRIQARKLVVHGHFCVNGKKVSSPSYLVSVGDVITLSPRSAEKAGLMSEVVDKRLNSTVKVPEWLELNKQDRKGNVLRFPVRADIQAPINENSIVELYSK